jgi:hypothetical protein
VLGGDLLLIDDGVTIEHLLSHRSGIGDHIDGDADDEITDCVLPGPCTNSTRPRCLLPQRARPELEVHPHRHLEHLRRSVADHAVPGSAPVVAA